jgi:hypothetical protein
MRSFGNVELGLCAYLNSHERKSRYRTKTPFTGMFNIELLWFSISLHKTFLSKAICRGDFWMDHPEDINILATACYTHTPLNGYRNYGFSLSLPLLPGLNYYGGRMRTKEEDIAWAKENDPEAVDIFTKE